MRRCNIEAILWAVKSVRMSVKDATTRLLILHQQAQKKAINKPRPGKTRNLSRKKPLEEFTYCEQCDTEYHPKTSVKCPRCRKELCQECYGDDHFYCKQCEKKIVREAEKVRTTPGKKRLKRKEALVR